MKFRSCVLIYYQLFILVVVLTLCPVAMEFESFLKLGQEIGLEGTELVQFARDRELLQEKKQQEQL